MQKRQRQGVSKQQIFKTATQLLEEGINVSVQSVRDRIGSGSFTTITKYLAEWREETPDQPADIPEIPASVQGAFTQIWAKASQLAQENLKTQSEALETARNEIEHEKSTMADEIERLEKELEAQIELQETTSQELEIERQNKTNAMESLTTLSIENAKINEQLKSCESLNKSAKREIVRLEKQLQEEASRSKKSQTDLEKVQKSKIEEIEKTSKLREEMLALKKKLNPTNNGLMNSKTS